MRGKGGIAGLAVLSLLALWATAARAERPDRSKPPQLGAVPNLRLPALQRFDLANGIPVWLVELHEVPVVQINVVGKSGAATDPAGKLGLSHLTADMLDEGAGSRTALQIADALDFLGATLQTGVGWDSSTVSLHVPVERLDDALPVLADVLQRPTFPPGELERLRRELLTELLQWRDEPQALAGVSLAQSLYGRRHRYGTSTVGTEASVRRFTPEDLKSFHARAFHPKSTTLIVVGDVTRAGIAPRLERTFGSWSGALAVSGHEPLPPAPQVKQRRVWIVDKPGAAQSEIRIGRIGFARGTPDYFPLLVMNTILGGSFTSRLNRNLREEHGYAYGASSRFEFRVSPGPFVASAAVQTDKTAPALAEFFKELKAIRETVTEEELVKAKNYVALSFPSEFETTRDIAEKLSELVVYELPAGFFDSYVSRVQAVSRADVARAASRAIDPEAAAVVVVGDRKKIEADVRRLALGPLRTLTVEDVLGNPRKVSMSFQRGFLRSPKPALLGRGTLAPDDPALPTAEGQHLNRPAARANQVSNQSRFTARGPPNPQAGRLFSLR